MNIELQTVKDRIAEQMPTLRAQYGVARLSLFGSYVRGDQRSDSDVDILVSFQRMPGLLKFIELENYLSDLLGKKVDLVLKEALKPAIGKRVLAEAVPI